MEISTPIIKTEAVVEVLSEVIAGLIGQPCSSSTVTETPTMELHPVDVEQSQSNDSLVSMVTQHSQETIPEVNIKSEVETKSKTPRRSQRRGLFWL